MGTPSQDSSQSSAILSRFQFPKFAAFQQALLAFAALAFSDVGQAEVPADFNIVTMNLHCIDENWRFRLSQIFDKMMEASADVIALQEVCVNQTSGENQIDFIHDYLNRHNFGVKTIESQFTHRAWDKYDEYIVLISKQRAEAVDKGFLPRSPLQRGYIAFNLGFGWVVDTHLEYANENVDFRRQQIKFLMDRFGNRAHLILGDFNSSPDSVEQAVFYRSEYKAVFPGDTLPLVPGESTKRIDGLWLSKGLMERIGGVQGRVFLNHRVNGQYLSDHFAVHSTFTISPRKWSRNADPARR